ncbi:uncharacterized protein PV09_03089 [Verruconis gallopava]|uniref:Uncharacterized protein n=1 Tax=Verruconis gallopava TaxID=253628 RepID=A0A0D2B3R4_9PEZI|nr:uncharacterized protein PV09_03089 [Verruconis gallopava]KIW05894.1 hypothetical protein PV09_03089 [Verruconis gallopava]
MLTPRPALYTRINLPHLAPEGITHKWSTQGCYQRRRLLFLSNLSPESLQKPLRAPRLSVQILSFACVCEPLDVFRSASAGTNSAPTYQNEGLPSKRTCRSGILEPR